MSSTTVAVLVCVGIIVACALAIFILNRLYPLDDESEQDWIDRQW